jgi:AcrR family transcriptional regulator
MTRASTSTDTAGTREPGRRERRKAENRALILEAARETFGEVGFEAATVRQIARRTGLASGTFYNYFPDKSVIFQAILEDNVEAMRRRVRDARRAAKSLEDFVDGAFRVFFETFAEDQIAFEVLSRNAAVIREFVDLDALRLGFAELREDVSGTVESGALPADIDADYLTAALGGVAFELCMTMFDREPPDVEGATRFATNFVLGGIERLRSGTGPAGRNT